MAPALTCRSVLSRSAIFLFASFAAQAAPLDFNRDIRPILSENCFYCHGQDPNKREGDLRLDVREAAVKLHAIVPGKSVESGMMKRLLTDDRDEVMPPPKANRHVSAAQRELLKRWIDEGANYSAHWAFIAPVRPPVPQVKDARWARNAVDGFVLEKLEAAGLQPSREASRETLIRRLSLDLIGLPPKPEEVDAFVADPSPDAYAMLVERLLASPHFGERMALPWLDAARFADSNGFQQEGDTHQYIWRDWVVNALNADMSFEQFSIEQLAGDLLPGRTESQHIASAFNRNHMLNGEGGAIPEEQRNVILFDRIDTTATNWLGLTVACAQCHDHKYDPITQRDYYSMMAMFNNVPETGTPSGNGQYRIAEPSIIVGTEEQKTKLTKLEAALAAAKKAESAAEKSPETVAAYEKAEMLEGKTLPDDIAAILKKPERTKDEAKKLRDYISKNHAPAALAKARADLKAAEKSLNEHRQTLPRAMVMSDEKPRKTHIYDRGEYLNPKDEVTMATPAFLTPMAADAPRNRLGFARWLFQPEHPLTARVQVNRVWQYFFGTGIVKTVEDLGVQSEYPQHMALLDWLAVEFRERGWSQKHIVRLIVNSATYRQDSRISKELLARDPENRLMARASRFRAPSMVLRDVALSASGLLDLKMGGKPVYPYQPDSVWEPLAITKERDFTYPDSKGSDLYRRSIYTFWRRTISPVNMFDSSSRQVCKVRGGTTSTPLHALTTLNDPTWAEAARVLAQRAMESAPDTVARATWAFRRVMGRAPKPEQIAVLQRAYEKQLVIYQQDEKSAAAAVAIGTAPKAEKLNPAEHAAMSAVCLAILNLDQSLTRE